MEHLMVLSQQAAEVASLGFNEPYFGDAPTYEQVAEWFELSHNIEIVVQKADSYNWYKFRIWDISADAKLFLADGYEYKTSREAKTMAVWYAIQLLKRKNSQ